MTNHKWGHQVILKFLENFSYATSRKIVAITKHLDTSILPSAHKDLALWMDSINGHAVRQRKCPRLSKLDWT